MTQHPQTMIAKDHRCRRDSRPHQKLQKAKPWREYKSQHGCIPRPRWTYQGRVDGMAGSHHPEADGRTPGWWHQHLLFREYIFFVVSGMGIPSTERVGAVTTT